MYVYMGSSKCSFGIGVIVVNYDDIVILLIKYSNFINYLIEMKCLVSGEKRVCILVEFLFNENG